MYTYHLKKKKNQIGWIERAGGLEHIFINLFNI